MTCEPAGYVYFVQCGDFVKVGFSVKPKTRVGGLATATPYDVHLLAAFPGTAQDEKAIHRYLAPHHHRREWFRACPAIDGLVERGLSAIPARVVRDVDHVFAAFGGPTRFAKAVGIKPTHANTMKVRGSIPARYWSRAAAAAEAQGIPGVTVEALLQAQCSA